MASDFGASPAPTVLRTAWQPVVEAVATQSKLSGGIRPLLQQVLCAPHPCFELLEWLVVNHRQKGEDINAVALGHAARSGQSLKTVLPSAYANLGFAHVGDAPSDDYHHSGIRGVELHKLLACSLTRINGGGKLSPPVVDRGPRVFYSATVVAGAALLPSNTATRSASLFARRL